MMKYILVLVLFGFFNVSLAHEGENWMSCVSETNCEEINLDHVVSVYYTTTEVQFYVYSSDTLKPLAPIRTVAECDIDNLRKGKHCFLKFQFEEETQEEPVMPEE